MWLLLLAALSPAHAKKPAPAPAPAPVPAPVAEDPPPAPAPAPAPPPSRPRPAHKPSPAPVTPTGTVSFEGADAVTLTGTAGRFGPGKVPAGTYSILATFGVGAPTPAGSVTVAAGQTVALRCDDRFKMCKPR